METHHLIVYRFIQVPANLSTTQYSNLNMLALPSLFAQLFALSVNQQFSTTIFFFS
jgi:hypothetical protein